jgi:alpha-galactosidase
MSKVDYPRPQMPGSRWSDATSTLTILLSLIAVTTHAYGQTREWILNNGRVSRTLTFDAQAGLTTSAWANVETGTGFIEAGERSGSCREFRLKTNDVTVTGAAEDVRIDGSPEVQHAGASVRLDLALLAQKTPLRIVVHYEAVAGFAGIRQWLTLENIGNKPITLRNVTFECQQLRPGPRHDVIAFGHYGEEPREPFFTGRVDDVAVLLENAKTGEGFAVLNEAPGYLRRTEVSWSPDWTPDIQAMYDTDLFPFERGLQPGEKYETAGASVVLYRRGTATDPHWVLPEYVEQVIAHNKNKQPPYWMYNDWQPWGWYATDAILKDVIPRATDMGLNLIALDAGWAKVWGDNALNKVNFPDGLKVLIPAAPKQSFKRGFWFPVALLSKDSSAYREHPDWVCRDRNGKPKESQDQGVVMCLASPYKQVAVDTIAEAVRTYGLSYVKLDLTTVFNAYGEEPGCYETGHEHASAAESSVRIYEALGWLADRLHEQFPDLLIDFTFELWGEKHVIDYGLLRVADLDWMANVMDRSFEDPGPIQVRTLLYQRGMTIPTEDMLIGALQVDTPTWQERVATEMASAPIFLGDTRKLSDEDIRQAAAWIARFQRLRQQIPLNESFFPLGAWRQPRTNAWDGFGRFSRTGEGLIVIFQNDSQDAAAEMAFPGFPDGYFQVTDWSGGTPLSVEGSQLNHGWTLPLPGKPRVRILELRKQEQGAINTSRH